MQVSATLIAAQQAAREARARLAMPQQAPAAPQGAGFAAVLEKAGGAGDAFSPLPLKQTAAPGAPAAAPMPQQGSVRLGQHVNIVV